MNRKDPIKKAATEAQSREDRLKSALKANLARRKAQARARTDSEAADRPDTPEDKD